MFPMVNTLTCMYVMFWTNPICEKMHSEWLKSAWILFHYTIVICIEILGYLITFSFWGTSCLTMDAKPVGHWHGPVGYGFQAWVVFIKFIQMHLNLSVPHNQIPAKCKICNLCLEYSCLCLQSNYVNTLLGKSSEPLLKWCSHIQHYLVPIFV